MFTRLLLEPDEAIQGSGKIFANFFYCVAQPDGGVRFNPVGSSFFACEFPDLKVSPRTPLMLCLRVQGMGDRNAVDICQATHEQVLRYCGAMRKNETLRFDNCSSWPRVAGA